MVFIVSATMISLTTYANDSHGIIDSKGLVYFAVLFSAIGYAIIMGHYDADKIITNHTSRVLYRGALLSLFPLLLWNNGGDEKRPEDFWLMLLGWAAFYLAFDQARNVYKYGWSGFFYMGGTADHDKLMKNVFNDNGEIFFLFKLGIFIGCCVWVWIKFVL